MAQQAAPVLASDLRTYPTRLNLTPGAAIGSINVHNNDTSKALLQLEAVRWYQENGEDKYEPTRDLLVNPVIFEVAPGADQVVRVGLQVGVTDVERSYRVFFQEVLPQDEAPKAGITTLLRIGIPIFVAPSHLVHALNWTATPSVANKLSIAVADGGTAHIQLTSYTLSRNGQALGKGNLFLYVLPGQSRSWNVETQSSVQTGDTLHLVAESDGGSIKADIVVGGSTEAAGQK